MTRLSRRVGILNVVLLVLVLCITVFPFYIMLVGAFKTTLSLNAIPIDLSPIQEFTTANMKKVIAKSNFLLWFKNSCLVSMSIGLITVFVSVTAGYAFARIKFRGRNLFFALVMATMMMPKQLLLVPNFMVAYKLKLTNSLFGLIISSIAPAFGVFLSRQAISSFPTEIFEAAEMDGCSELGKFFRIVVPLSWPTIGTVGILSFFTAFNDYLWPLLMISKKNLMTLPIGMAFFAQMNGNDRGGQLALALVATVPLVIIFIICQKFFIKGMTAGAVKG